MKTRLLYIVILSLAFSACVGNPESRVPAAPAVPGGAEMLLPFTHIDGFGTPTDNIGWIAWEFEAIDFVKYQVAYVSCTCRPDSINKRSLLYVEVNKGGTGGKTRKVWFDFWGDSQAMPDGTTREEVEKGFMPKLVNIKATALDGIDAMSGATVTTVNLKQILKALLAYHDSKYTKPGMPEAPDYADAVSGATGE